MCFSGSSASLNRSYTVRASSIERICSLCSELTKTNFSSSTCTQKKLPSLGVGNGLAVFKYSFAHFKNEFSGSSDIVFIADYLIAESHLNKIKGRVFKLCSRALLASVTGLLGKSHMYTVHRVMEVG